VAVISSRQIRAARALIGLGQRELAQRASIGIATLRRIEAAVGQITGTAKTMSQIQKALETAGVIFIEPDNEGGSGVRLRDPQT
jgi:transcriptional regulator with XRE-family HTH domain